MPAEKAPFLPGVFSALMPAEKAPFLPAIFGSKQARQTWNCSNACFLFSRQAFRVMAAVN
jgi:hypothetical protein